MNTVNLMPSGNRESSLVAINTAMYSNFKTEKCENLDDSWCLVNKRWCHLCTGCQKKQPTKEKPPTIAKSGEKYIYYNRAADKWHLQIEINGHKRSLGKSHDLQELVKKRDEYLKGVRNER